MAIVKDERPVYNPVNGGIDRVTKFREVIGDPRKGQARKSRLIGQTKIDSSGRTVYERGRQK